MDNSETLNDPNIADPNIAEPTLPEPTPDGSEQPPAPALETAPAVSGSEQVQATVDAENEAGYQGERLDPTPLQHYTLPGVLAGLPTPETDADQAALAGGTKFVGAGEATTQGNN